jgi:hypothetical protein
MLRAKAARLPEDRWERVRVHECNGDVMPQSSVGRSDRRLEGPVPTVPHVKEDSVFASKEDD